MQKLKTENRKKAERKKKEKCSAEEKQTITKLDVKTVKFDDTSSYKKERKLQNGLFCLKVNYLI